MVTIDGDTVIEILDHYGKDLQMNVAIEECSELQKELCKDKRGKGNKDHICEEVGDVLICIFQIIKAYEISQDDIQKSVDYKLAREKRRMKYGDSDETQTEE